MKYVFFATLIVLLFAGAGCNDKPNLPVITFDNTKLDIGSITKATKPVTVNFKFKNTGTKPLNVLHVASDCSCTIPLYTKEAVNSGNSGVIKVIFNPKTILARGNVEQQVVVHTNTQPRLHTLTIKMFVN